MIVLSILIALLTVVAIFIPILGGYLTVVPGLLTLFLPGRHTIFAAVISGVNIIDVLFMSPILRSNASMGLHNHDYKWATIYVGIVIFHAVAGLFVYFKSRRSRDRDQAGRAARSRGISPQGAVIGSIPVGFSDSETLAEPLRIPDTTPVATSIASGTRNRSPGSGK
ncbi:MAG: hypothetical protein HQL73_01645 [Magnetococcales bacterium]|nr:hypothetical protein [Magnetococcales bacterium]